MPAPQLYETNTGSTVEVIDSATDTIVASPGGVGVANGRIALFPNNMQAWVTGDPTNGGSRLDALDVATNTSLGPVGGGAYQNGIDLDFSLDSAICYLLNVINATSWQIQTINTATGASIGTLNLTNTSGLSPTDMCITADGLELFVSVNAGITVVATSSLTVVTTIALPSGFPATTGLRCNNANTTVYACTGKTSGGSTGAYVLIVDTASNTVTGSIDFHTLGFASNQIAISHDDSFAYATASTPTVSNFRQAVKLDLVGASVIGAATGTSAVNYQGLTILPDGTKAYVCDTGTVANGKVDIIDCSINAFAGSITTSTPYDICVTNPPQSTMQIVMVI